MTYLYEFMMNSETLLPPMLNYNLVYIVLGVYRKGKGGSEGKNNTVFPSCRSL